MAERTLVLVKPDGVRRGLIGEVIRRIEAKDLEMTRIDMRTVDRSTAETHYAEHADKPFYGELVEFITAGPVVAMIAEGQEAVGAVRSLMGATNPLDASPGTIRGDYATAITENIVHGSDSTDSAGREIGLFFPDA
jgi:nucleoside-diphosphate kinase